MTCQQQQQLLRWALSLQQGALAVHVTPPAPPGLPLLLCQAHKTEARTAAVRSACWAAGAAAQAKGQIQKKYTLHVF